MDYGNTDGAGWIERMDGGENIFNFFSFLSYISRGLEDWPTYVGLVYTRVLITERGSSPPPPFLYV